MTLQLFVSFRFSLSISRTRIRGQCIAWYARLLPSFRWYTLTDLGGMARQLSVPSILAIKFWPRGHFCPRGLNITVDLAVACRATDCRVQVECVPPRPRTRLGRMKRRVAAFFRRLVPCVPRHAGNCCLPCTCLLLLFTVICFL